jgi:hypothetical protein
MKMFNPDDLPPWLQYIIIAFLILAALGKCHGQTLTYELEFFSNRSSDAQKITSIRQKYRVKISEWKNGSLPEKVQTDWFSIIPATGVFECTIDSLFLSGFSTSIGAYDRQTDCHFQMWEYGRTYDENNKPAHAEYTVILFYRRGDYHLQVAEAGNVIISTGNVWLPWIFPRYLWDMRPVMAK